MPFASTATDISKDDGLFKLNPFQQQATFYNNQLTGQAGETSIGPNLLNWAFAKINFESSPLSRVIETYAPGVSWVGSEGEPNPANRHPVKTYYWMNTITDDVKVWNVTNASIGTFGAYSTNPGSPYPAGTLYKNIVTDERGYQIIEFKDKEGKIILKKVQLTAVADNGTGSSHTGWLCTYYVYDHLNNLRCVIQPEGVNAITSTWTLTTSLLNEQCFRYEYDERNRIIMKKIPGAAEIYMIYDRWTD